MGSCVIPTWQQRWNAAQMDPPNRLDLVEINLNFYTCKVLINLYLHKSKSSLKLWFLNALRPDCHPWTQICFSSNLKVPSFELIVTKKRPSERNGRLQRKCFGQFFLKKIWIFHQKQHIELLKIIFVKISLLNTDLELRISFPCCEKLDFIFIWMKPSDWSISREKHHSSEI